MSLKEVSIINTFNDVVLTKPSPLVICDIDDTLLYIPDIDEYMIERGIGNNVHNLITIFDMKKDIVEEFLNRRCVATDKEGFSELEKRVRELGGTLVFLTARGDLAHSYTIENFTDIGVDHKSYMVYYTNNWMSKGDYITFNFDLACYNEIVFIDDQDNAIRSVLDKNFKNMTCYKFVRKRRSCL